MLWFRIRVDCSQLVPGVQKDHKKEKNEYISCLEVLDVNF
jgi:hypothetical protein